MSILVTGATGYIGSHVTLELLKQGYDIVLLDNLSNSKISVVDSLSQLTGKELSLYKVDLLNVDDLEKVFAENKIEGVIHFAGFKSVEESIQKPLKYYHNNVGGLLNLCKTMMKFGVKNIVFSSSATVYGNKNKSPLTEEMDLSTINPYGTTKLMCEGILRDLYTSDNSWSINILRYFNPVGADKSGLIGEDPTHDPTNIMPIINKVASGKIEKIYIFGNDYDTPDGTCIRDFIHVTDLAQGHIKAIEKNQTEKGLRIYNLGTGRGYSVMELIKTFEKSTGMKVPYEFVGRRPGDVDVCYANPGKSWLEMGWEAEHNLAQMCEDSWRWEQTTKINPGD